MEEDKKAIFLWSIYCMYILVPGTGEKIYYICKEYIIGPISSLLLFDEPVVIL